MFALDNDSVIRLGPYFELVWLVVLDVESDLELASSSLMRTWESLPKRSKSALAMRSVEP